MSRNINWEQYINDNGDFEIAAYLYQSILGLMKHTLDMGTLLSTDKARLRAYKEQVKQVFKGQWLDVAQSLEAYGIIEPCGCTDEFCRDCKGSRYRLNVYLSEDEIQGMSVVINKYASEDDEELRDLLEEGMKKAMLEIKEAGLA